MKEIKKVPVIFQIIITGLISFVLLEMFMNNGSTYYYSKGNIFKLIATIFFDQTGKKLAFLFIIPTIVASVIGILGIWMNRSKLVIISAAEYVFLFLLSFLSFDIDFSAQAGYYLALAGTILLILFLIILFYNLKKNNTDPQAVEKSNAASGNVFGNMFSSSEPVSDNMSQESNIASTNNNVERRFCNKCGNRLSPDDIFCTKCGNRLR